jgi:hypothetical protein
VATQLFDGDLEKQGNIAHLSDSYIREKSAAWCSRRQERCGVQRRMWQGPTRCVVMVESAR